MITNVPVETWYIKRPTIKIKYRTMWIKDIFVIVILYLLPGCTHHFQPNSKNASSTLNSENHFADLGTEKNVADSVKCKETMHVVGLLEAHQISEIKLHDAGVGGAIQALNEATKTLRLAYVVINRTPDNDIKFDYSAIDKTALEILKEICKIYGYSWSVKNYTVILRPLDGDKAKAQGQPTQRKEELMGF